MYWAEPFPLTVLPRVSARACNGRFKAIHTSDKSEKSKRLGKGSNALLRSGRGRTGSTNTGHLLLWLMSILLEKILRRK